MSSILLLGSILASLSPGAVIPQDGRRIVGEPHRAASLPILRWPEETRGAPGFGLGAGIFYASVRQRSLRATSSRTSVTVRDLRRGTAETTELAGDPDLDNRKFDFDLELEVSGFHLPIVVPRLAGPRGPAMTFGVEAGIADVSFDVLDVAEPELGTTFTGDGPAFGAGLDVATCLDSTCVWTASGGYWWRYLPSLDVERALPAAASKLRVVSDEATLERQAHELSARVSYGASWGRRLYAPYAGVLYRRTDVEIENALVFLDEPLGLETDLRSRSRFASDTVLAIAGVEALLTRSLSGRLESFFGGGDRGVRFQGTWRPRRQGPGLDELRKQRRAERIEKRSRVSVEKRWRRLTRIASPILVALDRIEAAYRARWRELAAAEERSGLTGELFRDAEALLADTRSALVEALSDRKARRHRDLAPLRGTVVYRFGEALRQLEELSRSAGVPGGARPGVVPAAAVLAASSGERASATFARQDGPPESRGLLDRVLRAAAEVFPFLKSGLEDRECSQVALRFTSTLEDAEPVLDILYYVLGEELKGSPLGSDEEIYLPRGPYNFRAFASRGDRRRGASRLECVHPGVTAPDACPLDLASSPCGELECVLDEEGAYCAQYGESQLPPRCGGASCKVRIDGD